MPALPRRLALSNESENVTDISEFTPAPVPSEQELASFDHRTVPSPIEVIGDVRISAEPSLAGLSPDMRERVNAKLADASPAAREALLPKLILNELEANSYRLKVLAGPGRDANEYERECFGILREIYDLESEATRIEAELNDVTGYRTEYDDDGKPVAVPVYRFAPETQKGRQEALQSVRYKLAQIEREAPARRAAAAQRVQERIAAQNEEMEIHFKAKAKGKRGVRAALPVWP